MDKLQHIGESFEERKEVFLDAMKSLATSKYSQQPKSRIEEDVDKNFNDLLADFKEQGMYFPDDIRVLQQTLELHNASFVQSFQKVGQRAEERIVQFVEDDKMQPLLVYACIAMSSDSAKEPSLVEFAVPLLRLSQKYYECMGNIKYALSINEMIERIDMFTDFFRYLRYGNEKMEPEVIEIQEHVARFHDYLEKAVRTEQ